MKPFCVIWLTLANFLAALNCTAKDIDFSTRLDATLSVNRNSAKVEGIRFGNPIAIVLVLKNVSNAGVTLKEESLNADFGAFIIERNGLAVGELAPHPPPKLENKDVVSLLPGAEIAMIIRLPNGSLLNINGEEGKYMTKWRHYNTASCRFSLDRGGGLTISD